MKNIKASVRCWFLALALAFFNHNAVAQGTAFTYQGRLTVATNAANGYFDFEFVLFDAATGGAQTGPTVTDDHIGVTNGVFTVLLDFGSVYNGTPYWLQLGVRTNGASSFVAVNPRQELTPSPYAISAENVSGSVAAGQIQGPLVGSTATPLFEVDQNGTGTALYGNHATSSGTSAGVEGITMSTANSAAAVMGLVNSTSPGAYSTGVLGQNNSTTGFGVGVTGAQNGAGWGVYGTSPVGAGVFGFSSGGIGVSGQGATGVSATGATADGMDGTAASADGIGVKGDHSAGTGTAAGVQGSTESTDNFAIGVYGQVTVTNPGGLSAAVMGQNNGTGVSGIGVYGLQNGSGWGVLGDTPLGIGVLGRHNGATGTTAGVKGQTASQDWYAAGVYGVVTSGTPGGYSAGVLGQNLGTNGYGIGVYGTNTVGIGVEGAGGSVGVWALGGQVGIESSGSTGIVSTGTNGNGIDSYTYDTNSIGVYGVHDTISGTAAGVEGDTSSTEDEAVGVYGLVTSSSPGLSSVGVKGENNGTGGHGIGVFGLMHGNGSGVYGFSVGGAGVYGESGTGPGVYATSDAAGGPALTVGVGAIHVTGAGVSTSTAAFIQVATANNVEGASSHITVISNSICDGDPYAILIATHNYQPPGAPANDETHPYSVWYDGTHWTIYHDDLTSIIGQSFNVLIIKN